MRVDVWYTARSAIPAASCTVERRGGTLRVRAVPRPTEGVVTLADGGRFVWLTAGDLVDADVYATVDGLRKLAGDDREQIWDLILGAYAELAIASDDEEDLIARVGAEVMAATPLNGVATNTN